MNEDSFSGKLVIVTGGSKGIGKATAKRIGELGGSVCIVARGKKALTEASYRHRAKYIKSHFLVKKLLKEERWFHAGNRCMTKAAPLISKVALRETILFLSPRVWPDGISTSRTSYSVPEHVSTIEPESGTTDTISPMQFTNVSDRSCTNMIS